jgi:hypothetical protein
MSKLQGGKVQKISFFSVLAKILVRGWFQHLSHMINTQEYFNKKDIRSNLQKIPRPEEHELLGSRDVTLRIQGRT